MQSNTNHPRSEGSRPRTTKTVKKKSKKAKQQRSGIQRVSSSLTSPARITQTRVRTVRDDGHSKDLVATQLLGTVVCPASNAFQITNRFRVNPGSAITFPWAAPQALCYEYYRFKKLVFRYVPFISKTSSGSVLSTWEYDAADAAPIGAAEQQLFSNENTRESPQYDAHVNPAKVGMLNRLYKAHAVMSDGRFATSSQDEKTIDCAQLFVAVESNSTAGDKLGKMFLDYVVELISPQMVSELPNQGGASFNKTSNIASTTLPFVTNTSSANMILESAGNALLLPANQFSLATNGLAVPTLPSAVIGQFLRDFQGISAATKINNGAGTNFDAPPTLYVAPISNVNVAAGSSGDVLQPLVGQGAGVGNILASRHATISAKQGDLLKMSLADGTSSVLSGVGLSLGGFL
jgi:hypothetical protein